MPRPRPEPGPSQDTAKVVLASGSCEDAPAGGTAEALRLGPTDATGATGASASFSFSTAGRVYKLCYKLVRSGGHGWELCAGGECKLHGGGCGPDPLAGRRREWVPSRQAPPPC